MPSLVEICPEALEKKVLFKFCYIFVLFCNYLIISPWKRGRAFHLNKLESYSSMDTLCQVWLKLAQWFWRQFFLNVVNEFQLICYYLNLFKTGVKSPFWIINGLVLLYSSVQNSQSSDGQWRPKLTLDDLKLFSTRPTNDRWFYVLSSSWKVLGQNFNMFLQFQKIKTD